MSASCEFKLTYEGKEEDFNKLWKRLHQIEDVDVKNSDEQISPVFRRTGNEIATDNGQAHKIWGKDAWQP